MIAPSDLAREAGEFQLSGLFLVGVCEVFGVTFSDLKGPRRGIVTSARWALSYLHREHLGWSFERIGELMDKKHDTALYGYAQACVLIHEQIEPFAGAVEYIEKETIP